MRNRSRYIAFAFLAVFMFTFSFQNMAAITRNFKIDISTVFNGKYLQTIHTPGDNLSTENSPFENENEDESETEVVPFEMMMNYSQDFLLLQPAHTYFSSAHEHDKHSDDQHPLYLVICTFRI